MTTRRKTNPIDKINKQIVDEQGMKNVLKVLKSGFLSKPEGGVFVKRFQGKISKLINKQHCFTTNSGTSALHAAVACLGLNKDDEVLMPALTFIADASVVIQQQAKPVFVDVSPDDFNLDPDDVRRKITKKTKALIVVHLYGKPAKMDELVTIARENGLVLIEDCAQAIGAKYKGTVVGSFGDFSCFSFYQTKHLVTGEGGMVATNSNKYAEILRSILNNGINRANLEDYDFDHLGFNYQMTEIQAALGLRQLERLSKLNQIRRKHADLYRNFFKGTSIKFQSDDKNSYNVYCYLTGLLPKEMTGKRDEFISKLIDMHIPIKKQYPVILPETTIYKALDLECESNTPNSHDISKRVFNLYVNPGLDTEDIQYFATSILKTYREIGGI